MPSAAVDVVAVVVVVAYFWGTVRIIVIDRDKVHTHIKLKRFAGRVHALDEDFLSCALIFSNIAHTHTTHHVYAVCVLNSRTENYRWFIAFIKFRAFH